MRLLNIKSTRLYNWIFRTRNRVELLEILFSKFKFNFNSMEFCFKQEIKSLKAEVWDLKQRVAKLEVAYKSLVANDASKHNS